LRSPHLAVGAAVVIALAATVAFLAIELSALHAGVRDYDEGIYWQTLRAMGRGEALYRDIWSSSPPAFYYALLPFYLAGQGIEDLRLGIVVFAAAGIIATYAAGRLIAGPISGLLAAGLLASTWLYLHEGAILQADVPAGAVTVVALALLLGAGRANPRLRLALGFLSGLCVALAIGMKLSGAIVLFPVGVYLWQFRSRWLLFSLAGGLLIGAGMLALPIVGATRSAYLDMIQSHVGAGQSLNRPLGANLYVFTARRLIPLETLAAGGAIVMLAVRDSRVLPLLAWAVTAVAAIIVYQPLFPHHLVILIAPLALIGGAAISRLASVGPIPVVAGLSMACLTVAVGLVLSIRDATNPIPTGRHEVALASTLRSETHAGDFIISDNPYAIALADRPVPGPLVDLTLQRIGADELSISDVEAAALQYRVKFVLVDSTRLSQLPGFAQWVDAHYRVVAHLDGNAVLYGAG
jgi:4-amino-4-deoxy-L-arabinose transferase-like glycosyltransferase